ncbi:MAG: hypothetical protein K6E50_14530, partial [Lachnospiraceae bacterium]|nr:hypothetical protein [Lachnospiraceae bacterium]
EISSSCAHAWPEAYLDGIGWIGFEPTPGYESGLSGWYTSAEREGAAKKEDERGSRGTMTAEERRAAQQEAAPEEEEEEEPRFKLRWYQAVIPLLAGAVPSLLIFAADAARRRRQYLAMSERDKSLFQCRRGLKLLKRLHIPRSEDETLEEYARRIEKQVPAERLGFLKTYEELLYSRKQTGEKERLALEEEMERLRLYVREARRHGTEAENGEQGEEDKGEEGTR